MSEESGAAPTFREQAMDRMASERDSTPVEPAPENPEHEEPEEIGNSEFSADDAAFGEVETQELQDDEYGSEDEQLEPDSDDQPDHDWEKRYKDIQRELTRYQQEREGYTSEISEMMVESTRTQHELEDSLGQAKQMAEMLTQQWAGNAQKFRNIDWSQVPADQIPALQQQAQQAIVAEQQARQHLEMVNHQQSAIYEKQMQRQAAVATQRLKVRVPNWNQETYSSIRNHAQGLGLDPKMFNTITDPAVIEMFHDSMMYRSAGKKAKTLSKQKSRKPSAANTQRSSRDNRGRFASAKQNFESNPGQKGSFAAMKEAQLRMER